MNNLFNKFKLDNNSIVVCTNDIHKEIQSHYKDSLIPFKVMNYSNFINYVLGELSNDSVIDLIKKGYNYELSKVLCSNFLVYYHLNINDNLLNQVKDDILKSYKINKYIKSELSKKEVVFINPNLTNDLVKTTLNLYKNIYTYETFSVKKDNCNIYEFNNIDDEVDFVCKKVSNDLLNVKNDIYIYISNNDYLPILKSKFDLMNVLYTTDLKTSLDEVIYSKKIIEYIDSHVNNRNSLTELFEEAILDISTKYIISSNNLEKIYNIFNDYIKYDISEYKYIEKSIKDGFKNATLAQEELDTNLHIITKLPSSLNNLYMYFLGCNQNSFPVLVKNSDYFKDNLRKQYNLLTSKEINEFNITNLISEINSLKQGVFTYNISKNQIISDVLVKLNKLASINDAENNISKIYDEVEFAKALDNYYIYQKEDNNLTNLYQKDVKEKYQSFDNKFNGTFIIDKNIKVSATSLSMYYECKYHYYLENILHVEYFKDDSAAKLGAYFHLMLKKLFNNEMTLNNLDEETLIYMVDNNVSDSNQVKYYYNRYKECIIKTYNIIKDLYHNTNFNKIEFEKEIKEVLHTTSNDKVYTDLVVGIIDKYFIYQINEIQKVLIVDYKTGDSDIKLDLLEYGLNLQVPFYFYLLSLGEENISLLGAFIQKVMPKKMYEHKEKLTVDEQYKKELVYKGLYNTEHKVILNNINNNTTAITDEQVNWIIETVAHLIDNGLKMIHEGNFIIDPKVISGKSKCKFCPYSAICYKNYHDYKYIDPKGGNK